MRIEIIAPMGAGKSSVIEHMSGAFDFALVQEDLSANPFLDLRKKNPAAYALPCQKKFISDKIGSLSTAIEGCDLDIIADFSVWTERAYARYLLPEHVDEVSRMSRQVDEFYEKYGLPDLLVYISISTKEQMERIKNRGRDFEQAHSYDYLSGLNKEIESEASLAILTGAQTLVLDAGKMTSAEMAISILDEIELKPTHNVAA